VTGKARDQNTREETIAVRPLAARAALDDVRRLQDIGRRRLTTVWFPLAVFGVIYLGMAPLALTVHRNHLGPYFLVALIAASFATARHYKRRGESDGIETSVWPWLATSIAMTIGGGVASVAGFNHHSLFLDSTGPFLVVTGFFLAFALLTRSTLLLADALTMLLVCAVATAISDGDWRVAAEASAFSILLLASARHQHKTEAHPSR
jgi:hypothetical protein